MPAGNNAGNGSALKHPGARGSGTMGDATTAGEAISSAIVKYNYQAQQVTTKGVLHPFYSLAGINKLCTQISNVNQYMYSFSFLRQIQNLFFSWTN